MGLKYNPNNDNIFDITNEKTDYRTDLKTDHKTDNVTWHSRRRCSGPFWRRRCWNENYSVPNTEKNKQNKKLNEDNTKLNADNKALNEKNTKRNNAYAEAVTTAKTTNSGEYAVKRNTLRDLDVDDEVKNILEGEFKTFYRDKKLQVWNSDLGTKPDYGDFDPSYYGSTYANVKNKYKEYEDDDDIDVTEGYGKENYYYWHYTNQGKAEGNRGNKAEILAQTRDYLEEAPQFAEGGWENQTDTELAFIRDQQLGIGDNQTERFLNVPEIAALWEEAKQASQEGKANHFINLGKEYFLDVNKADEFAALFRLSNRPEDKQISFDYSLESGNATGITELEDTITGSIGAQGITDTKKFAALNQNILKDSINELKKAKIKEQELDMLSGFGTFGEIFDINKTLRIF